MTAMTEVGLYIHVPFCAVRCGYCDFYTNVPGKGEMAPLVDALLTELANAVESRSVRVRTIFVGGGTPSLLPVALLTRLFERLGAIARRHRPLEFTVEVNPASLTDTKAAILRDNNVNRISMGAQSFHANELRVLDRIHGPGDLAPSAEIVRRSGFEHFNLDLMFGIPGQTAASCAESIRRAIDLGPDHLSCYSLTYEPGTPLLAKREAGLIHPVDEDYDADLYLTVQDQLSAAGFAQYEISNFARPGAESQHNLRYWRNQPVLGIGPSAASYLDGRRWRNLPDTAEYVRRIMAGLDTTVDREELSPMARAGETAMLGLRLNEGIERSRFLAATGFDPFELFAEAIERHVASGFIAVEGGKIVLTRAGRLLADMIGADFLLPDEASGRKAESLKSLP